METRLVALIILGLAVIVSGCADNQNNSDTTVGASSEKGLEIQSLGVADSSLTPGQQTRIYLTLKNYHTEPIDITEMSIFNEGSLEVSDKVCNPSEIGAAKQGIAPEMECSWNLKAPPKEDLGAFESKPMPVNLRLAYESNIVNSEPLTVQFKPVSDIERAREVSKTYSNGEVEASMALESPASFQGRNIDIAVRNAGPGEVEGGYEFIYTPDVFDCPSEREPVVGDSVEFSCRVEDDKEAIRNLFTSISYKYVKTPTLDIEVVNR